MIMNKNADHKMQLMLEGKPIAYRETLPDSIELDHDYKDCTKCTLENREFTFEVTISESEIDKLDALFIEARNAIIEGITKDRISTIKHNNKDYTMEWQNINENKPIDGARVLVCDTYYKRVTIAAYNENNESWDNEEGMSYKLSRCPYWTELPEFKEE